MSKHTPGPWEYLPWRGHYALSSDDSAEGFSFIAGGYRLPLCDLEGDIDIAQANARLISAAPDLLAALHAVLNASGDDETLAAYKAARAAIKKAEDV